MGTTSSVNNTELIDIESYCNELSSISGLNIDTVQFVVLTNFASIYSNKVSFLDATDNIVREINSMVQRRYAQKKTRNIKKQVLS